jgi:hypothetical protein
MALLKVESVVGMVVRKESSDGCVSVCVSLVATKEVERENKADQCANI